MRILFSTATLAGSVAVLAATTVAQRPAPAPIIQVPSSCAVTLPADPRFTPPAPYPVEAPFPNRFFYGTPDFWTMLPVDGVWRGMPPTKGYRLGYRDKVFWWRPGYDGRTEPRPKLTVSGKRLDGDTPPFSDTDATSAYADDLGGWTMLTALDIPTTGCWEISGSYGSDVVKFTVWVAP